MSQPTEDETEEQTAARKADYEQRKADALAAEERRREEQRAADEREEAESEKRRVQIEKQKAKRDASFQRIVKAAPPVFNAAQLRALLRALVNLDPYSFADDLAVEVNGNAQDDRRSADEVLTSAIDGLGDAELTTFAIRLALSGHRGIPRENEIDHLSEAEAASLESSPPSPL